MEPNPNPFPHLTDAKPESEGSEGKKSSDASQEEGDNGKKDDHKEEEKTDDKKAEEKKGEETETKEGEKPDAEKKEEKQDAEKKDEHKEEDKPEAEKKENGKEEGEKKAEDKPESEKSEGEKPQEEKKGEDKPEAEKGEGEKPDGEKKELEKKDDEKAEKKDEKKDDEKQEGEKKVEEKKEEEKKEEKKDEDKKDVAKKDEPKPEEKKDEKKPTEVPSKKAEPEPKDAKGVPTKAIVAKCPKTGRVGKKVDPKYLRPAEAVIKTRERRKSSSSSKSRSRSSGTSSSGMVSVSSPSSFKSSTKVASKILQNSGATKIVDEDYFKKNKKVLVLRERELATGTYSIYYKVKVQSGEDLGIKILTLMNASEAYKNNLTSQSLKIMRWLTEYANDNIVQPLDLFISTHKLYMFVPCYSFGNLESLVTPKVAPSEGKIRMLMKQMAEGMKFLTSHGIAHRAIKTTHGVFSSADRKQVKICGFGNAIVAKEGDKVQLQKKLSKDNYIPYMAPEVLKGDWDPFVADLFSFGAMIIALLTKRYPFGPYKQSRKKTDQWRRRFHRFGVKPSSELEDLLDKIVAEPSTRISLHDLLLHKWFNV